MNPALPNSSVWECIQALPRQNLIRAQTPLLPLHNLSRELGIADIWCKRDDLISFGLGGNKIRGLELLVADALAKKSDVLVTGAGPQSNHVRATAATAAYFGLRCAAIYWGNPPAKQDGNFRLTDMFGAELIFTGDTERSSVDSGIESHAEKLNRQGLRPYKIPRGGACALGALGHVLAAREVYQQCRDAGISPGTVVLATGSGGTHAGWLLGTRLLGEPWQIESYTVSREADAVRSEIARIATKAAAMLNSEEAFTEHDVTVHGGFIGQGYGIPSPEAAKTIRLLGRTEGLLLDPTYTGKAMAGFLNTLKRERKYVKPVVFVHTGGEPAFFAGDGEWLRQPDC
jgi:D-cysteine desulfhydrase family pyridoxal phosphate-dependent enzyme